MPFKDILPTPMPALPLVTNGRAFPVPAHIIRARLNQGI
uniref:Uncharacterized protein n=1 Tax=Manihot esculenta TaxID=3983 RepID=A0A199U8Y1_MANES